MVVNSDWLVELKGFCHIGFQLFWYWCSDVSTQWWQEIAEFKRAEAWRCAAPQQSCTFTASDYPFKVPKNCVFYLKALL